MRDKKGVSTSVKARAIAEAAYESLIEHGFCDLNTQMIAERAGVSKSMIHYYYRDKNALISEVARMVIDRLAEMVWEVGSRSTNSREMIDRGLTELWEAFLADQGFWIALFENAVNGRRIPEIRKNLVTFYRELLHQIATLLLSAEDLQGRITAKDAEAIASILAGTMESFALQSLIDPEATDFAYSLEMLKRVVKQLVA